MKYIASPFIAFISLFGIHTASGQLAVISDQNINFSNAVSTISDGDWSSPSIWSGGVVPDASDDVVVNHTVYIDIQGANSGDIVDLCRNIKVAQDGVLRLGHDTDNFNKELRINGSIVCNGTFSAGRVDPGNDPGTGEIYTYNANINLSLSGSETAYISGSGFFNPKDIKITSSTADKNLIVDIYNMITDGNFVVKSNNRVHVEITKYAYLNIKGVLGLTGSTYQWSSATAKADLVVHGVVLANDVSLFTKNTTSGEGSSITIKDKGSLTVGKINNANLNKKTEAAGYTLTIDQGGLFKLGEEINFYNLTLDNPNFVLANSGEVRYHFSETLPSKSAITAAIDAYDPNEGIDVSQIKDIFGASNIAGWYNFTSKPFMEEGLDFYEQFGATSIKTTLTTENDKMYKAYTFNNTWPSFNTLKEVAQHPQVDALFQRAHIKTHTFWTTTRNKGDWKKGPDIDHASFINEEQQFYDLTKHLLETYGSMDKVFVYQNWEGDWMLRGQGVIWENSNNNNYQPVPDDVQWNIEGMARMFRARQRGTERARKEHLSANAKVFHGIEFNKLWWNDSGTRKTMMDSDIPCVIADVASKTRLDLTSWSAYDGGWSNNDNPHGHAMWKGLEMARYFTNETKAINSNFPVQIGEFAINENPPYNGNNTQSVIENRYGRYIGVALGLGIPNFYLWNLYCSVQQGGPSGHTWEKGVQYEDAFLYEWMDGKWLIEPDGSWGHAAYFLMSQWQQNPNNSITLNVKDIDTSKLCLYPNPSNEHFFIESSFESEVETSIYSLNGKLLKTIKHNTKTPISTKDLTIGTYAISVRTNEIALTKLLIINK